jgi:DNA-3-methyladenine glycosylase I
MPTRCPWALKSPQYIRYHDEEWGVPSHDDRHLFEMLVLEGAQAGLSWSTILNKRDGYRTAFADFDAAQVARFDGRRRARLLGNPAIVRNRQKIDAAIENARHVLEVREEFGSLSAFLWDRVGGGPVRNAWRSLRQVPAQTPVSKALSKALAARGFRFVGPTTCYAFMQAVGMVNDHLVTCFRYKQIR